MQGKPSSNANQKVFFSHIKKITVLMNNICCACQDFGFPRTASTPHYPKMPLAFSLVVHNNAGLVMKQLQLLFRPHHAFCFYVDAKAGQEFISFIDELVECYRLAGFWVKFNLPL